MKNYLVCLLAVAALGAACTQQSPQQPPAAGQDSAAAPAAGATSTTPNSSAAQPGRPATGAAPAASAVGTPPPPPKPSFKEVTIPSGTSIAVTLDTPLGSDTSKVEDTVRGKLAKPIVIDAATVAPAGSAVSGNVLAAAPSGKVKGRASIAFRFEKLTVRDETLNMRTARISREAASTKKEDAKKVGIGAGAGALIGAIAGGGKGAAIGTAVGAGAGTGVVMATKGDEIHLAAGTTVNTTIQEPVKVLVPID